MGLWDAAVAIGGKIVDYKTDDRLAEKQSERNLVANAQLQSSAQSFNKSMYDTSWSNTKAENRWSWDQQQKANTLDWDRTKGENRWAWEEKKREARYWANEGHSIEVAALRKAGLNPILAATGGFHGASAPMLSQNSAKANTSPGGARSSATTSPGGSSTSSAAKTAALAQNYAQLKLLDAQTANINSSTSINQKRAIGETINNTAKGVALEQSIIDKDIKKNTSWYKKSQTYKYVWQPLKDVFSSTKNAPNITRIKQ